MDHPLVGGEAQLVGGQVQRVRVAHLAGREVALLKIRVPPRSSLNLSGENVHVALAAGMGVGVVSDTEGAPLRSAMQGAISPAQTQWRAWLEGGRVVEARTWSLVFVRDGRSWRADARRTGDLVLSDPSVAEQHPAGLAPNPPLHELESEALRARGKAIVDALVRAGAAFRRDALRRALTKAIARLDRRIDAVRGDLARMEAAVAASEHARLFVAQAAQAQRGATKLEAVDWASGEERPVTMVIDPATTAKEQVDALFKRARRLRDGKKVAFARLADGQKARAALAAVADMLADTQEDGVSLTPRGADLADLEARARVAAPRDFKLGPHLGPRPQSRSRVQVARAPYRTFIGESGTHILVGRGAEHNDALTLHASRPHDMWLHAKGATGAHVIVPLDKGRSCPADLLVEAAHLAAHFSGARDEGVVEVEYTSRRYVRKPRGSPPGLVVVDREKVILLRREEKTLRRLLESEVVE
jgi:hypothetical protein